MNSALWCKKLTKTEHLNVATQLPLQSPRQWHIHQSNTKLVGVLVTFSPSEAQISRVSTISSELDFVFVVDNTEYNTSILSYNTDRFPDNVRILLNSNVGGIAGALNMGIREATKNFGECFIFLLDQDSCLPVSFFEKQYVFAAENNKMVVVPKYFDINSRTFGNYTRLSKWKIKNINGEHTVRPFEVTFAITSGTLIFSSLFEKVGYFCEEYFIDHVDSEFCIRLQESGHLILVNPDVVFEHAIGKRKLRKFLGVNFKPNFHSPVRRYYAVRNGIFMIRQHFRFFPSVLWLIILRLGYEYIGIILFENARWAKLKALYWGFIDAILLNAGRCNRRF